MKAEKPFHRENIFRVYTQFCRTIVKKTVADHSFLLTPVRTLEINQV